MHACEKVRPFLRPVRASYFHHLPFPFAADCAFWRALRSYSSAIGP